VQIFSPRKSKLHEVQSFMLKVINNSCPDLKSLWDGPRAESRVNLTVVVVVIPVVRRKPVLEKMFGAVTKELTTLGVSVVLNDPRSVDEVIVAFRWEGEMKFVRAQAKHLTPLGAGFYQLGLELKEVIHVSDCPVLESVQF
jgi:hypothetical protein